MPYIRIFFHLTWSTDQRLPTIGPTEEAECRRSFKLTCDDLDLIPHAIGFMPDHVHIAISLPSTVTLAETVRRLKGASSYGINKEKHRSSDATFRWQREYGALTFGERSLPFVVDYIENQRERHANQRLVPKMERSEPLE